MTPEDEIKKIVRDLLEQDGPELAARRRKEQAARDLTDYVQRQREARETRESAVDATSAPVHYEETVLEPQTTFYTDPTPDGGGGQPVPPAPFSTVRTRICLEDGSVAVVNVVVQ